MSLSPSEIWRGNFFAQGVDKTKMTAKPYQNYTQIPVVAVIMSTYNGEKYLAEQIDSILAQKNVHVELFIRDDGSTDGTRNIISDYAGRYGSIHADFGKNLGWVESFMTELFAAPGFKYYAFSDQDDVWNPEKLAMGVKAIKQEEERHGENFPVMWQSSHIVTDSKLNTLFAKSRTYRVFSLESFLLRPYGAGNAMMFNAKTWELVKKIYNAGWFKGSHDFWITAVTHAFGGSVIVSPEAYVLFRQHGNNTSALPLTLFSRLRAEFWKIRKNMNSTTLYATGLLKVYGDDVSPAVRKSLELVSGYKDNFMCRLKIMFSTKFRTGDIRLTCLEKLKALFGLL